MEKEGIATLDVKEESVKVAGGKCWRRKCLSALNVTGEIFNRNTKKYFPETWILPFIVLLAMAAYAVLAIVFYNNDG